MQATVPPRFRVTISVSHPVATSFNTYPSDKITDKGKTKTMNMYGGVDLLTSALVVGKWSASRPGRFAPGAH
jgi:hypothetical protein